MSKFRCNYNEEKIEFEKKDFRNPVESLQHLGKALTKIQQQLGIKDVALPLLDESEM